jgi:hypothetical protein
MRTKWAEGMLRLKSFLWGLIAALDQKFKQYKRKTYFGSSSFTEFEKTNWPKSFQTGFLSLKALA